MVQYISNNNGLVVSAFCEKVLCCGNSIRLTAVALHKALQFEHEMGFHTLIIYYD